ncbi:hypothetical protein TNCV_240391 [Trichonephila clavipes]|nr:hypothetical protein TNCV_240391 [Trichonephila clavipes]
MSGSISTLTAHICQKQPEPVRDDFVGCLRVHWPLKGTPPTTLSSSLIARLRPYSGSQVMLGPPSMKELVKKPSREPCRLNRKYP